MPNYTQIMASEPSVFQNTTVSTLLASGQVLGAGWSLFQSVADLTGSFEGSAQQTQAGQADSLAGRGGKLLGSIATAQTAISAGSQMMQAAKARLQALTA